MQVLELSEQTRLSLLRGYVERSWCRPDLAAARAVVVDGRVTDEQAYLDGRRLRDALDGLIAASTFEELNLAEQVYDEVAHELNARYGGNLVVLASEDDEPGLRGFRNDGFGTRSSRLLGEERIAG